MTSKERAKLKSLAAKEDAILQIGKNPLSDTFVKQVRDALAARELIKITVLETCEMLPLELARELEARAECEAVQVIGSKVVLFKRRGSADKKPSLLAETTVSKPQNSHSKNKNVTKERKSEFKKSAKDGFNRYGKNAKTAKAETKPQPYKPKAGRIRSLSKKKK